jgi:Zn-dependent protease with chaperone function
MGAVLAGVVAVLLVSLLVAAVGAAGGWRRVRPATAADQASARPPASAAGLDQRRWRVRTVADVLQLILVVALGMTPLGARFVHLVAPKGDTWHDAAAWLLILAAVAAVVRLPVLWWQRQARRATPGLFRPRAAPGRRIARAALAAVGLLNLVLWVVALLLDIRSEGGAYQGLFSAVAVITWLLVPTRAIAIWRLPRSDQLSGIVSSLPGDPSIPVVSSWPGAVANVGVLVPWRPVILIAPPITATLTDRELRAVLAHEVAHVRHGDARRRVLRRLLMMLCVLAALAALYGIPALRSLAGLHGRLSAQAGPFLLAVSYLVFRVLRAVELRAIRAEELAADRGMIALTGDPDACSDALGRLTYLLGTPAAWTLPQRLLFATHPATSERLRLLGDPVPVADIQPGAGLGDRVARGLLAGVLVLVAAVVAIAVATASGSFDHRVIAVSAAMGKYRVVLPRHVGAAPLDTVSTDAAQLRSSVWGAGDISRFPGAAPVTAVYDEEDISWLYVWGAYGKLADPSEELSAFWNKYSFGMNVYPDAEPAGPLGGELQCDNGTMTCAWADNSAIVVVSLATPGSVEWGDVTFAGALITERQLARMTLSLRDAAEVLIQRSHLT